MKRSRPRLALIAILCYELKALAIITFVLMIFCMSKAMTLPQETIWWMHALKTGAAWIILWWLAWFIDIRDEET